MAVPRDQVAAKFGNDGDDDSSIESQVSLPVGPLGYYASGIFPSASKTLFDNSVWEVEDFQTVS